MRLFEVPIVQPDLRHEESILQSLNSLDYLNQIIENVFNRIDEKISKNHQRIQDINDRMMVANRKIESLRNTKKAVTIYSTNKYPEANTNFSPVFNTIEKNQDVELKILTHKDLKSSPEKLSNKKPHEKLQFYHVKFAEKEKPKKVAKVLAANVPVEILRTIDSLLVFRKDEKIEKSKSSSASSMPIDGGKRLDAAPSSITNKNQKKQLESIFYAPSGLDNAPELDVPIDLPDLPGIADGITFDINDGFLITPSSIPKSAFVGDNNLIKHVPVSEEVTKVDEPEQKIIKPVEIHMPTTIPMMQKESNYEKTEPIKENPKEFLIPPPPPPPSMDLLKTDASSTKTETPQLSNARMNLLADIRKAGGKVKLRPAAAAERVPSSEKKKEKPPPTEDFMSDLRNRLQMRRKGISGSKEPDQPSNVMSRLATLIPPPNQEEQIPNANESDEDWK